MRGVCEGCQRLLDWRYGDGEHLCADCQEAPEALPPAIEPPAGPWEPLRGRIGETGFGTGGKAQ